MLIYRIAEIFGRLIIYIAIYIALLYLCVSVWVGVIAEIMMIIEPCGGFECLGHGIIVMVSGLILGSCSGSIIFVLLVYYHHRLRNVKQKRKRSV
jgi:hypothetical protein